MNVSENENEVQMTLEDIRKINFNVKKSPKAPEDPQAVPKAPKTSTSTSYSLASLMGPVYNQGNLGSCTANAIGALVRYHLNVQLNNLNPNSTSDFQPSRLFIYFMERNMEGTIDWDSGATLNDGLASLKKNGVCPEVDYPYIIANYKTRPSEKAVTDAIQHRFQDPVSIPVNVNDIKGYIEQGYPVVIGILVYSNFMTQEVAESGIMPMPTSTDTLVGGHAVCIIGFDDSKQSLLVRNSWGSAWGLQGNFWMPYAYVTGETEESGQETPYCFEAWTLEGPETK